MGDHPAENLPGAIKPTRVRYLVLAALCVITMIAYIQRNCLGAAETTVQRKLGLDPLETGTAISAFFLSYALFQVPSGWLGQVWGPRRALAFFAAGWSLALGVGALSRSLGPLIASRLAMGALQAGIFPCATLAIAAWFPTSQRGMASGVLSSFMQVGSAIGSVLSGAMLGLTSWEGMFTIYTIPGLLWAVWFLVWFRDRPSEHPRVNAAEAAQAGSAMTKPVAGPTPWLLILLSPSLFLINAQQFCRAGANRFIDQNLATYLEQVRGLSTLDAGAWASVPLWAAVAGTLFGGWLSDLILARTGSRRAARQGVALGTLILSLICYLAAYACNDFLPAILLLSAGNFLGTASAPCAYALTIDVSGRQLAIVFGIMNMAGNLGATFFPWMVGWLRKYYSWDSALALFFFMNLVGAICWLFLNPRGTLADPNSTEK